MERGGNTENSAATDLETKQIQVTMRASRTGATTVAANQSALSTRYILRNKIARAMSPFLRAGKSVGGQGNPNRPI